MMLPDVVAGPDVISAASSTSSHLLRRRSGLRLSTPEPLKPTAPPQDAPGSPHSPYSIQRILLSSNNVHDFSAALSTEAHSLVSFSPANCWINYTPRLDYIEYVDEQALALTKVSRKRALAQHRVFIKRLDEMATVREAVRASEDNPDCFIECQAHHALAIARAAQATLTEEVELADCRISEAKLRLKAIQDEAETIKRKRTLADKQVGLIFKSMENDGLTPEPIGSSNLHRRAESWPMTRRPWPLQPLPSSDSSEPESDISGFESFYDALACPSKADEDKVIL